MAKVFIEESTLTAIGDSIREKTGKTELIDPALMSAEIKSIEAGGGPDIPEEAFVLSGSGNNRFANGNWDWFVKLYADRISTKDLEVCTNMFNNSKVEELPFQFNLKAPTSSTATYLSGMFNLMPLLKVCPKVRGEINWTNNSTTLKDCTGHLSRVRDLEDLFTPEMTEGFSTYKCTSAYSFPKLNNFDSCQSLRRVPSWWYNFKLNSESTAFPSASSTPYYYTVYTCYVLDEIKDIPVWTCQAAQNSNMFSYTFANSRRLKAITFETDNGQPIVTKWKSQTIDLTSAVGYELLYSQLIDLNSGITRDKEVKDDATYQALKNDPDWFTALVGYSRYNHDSAVETINSLPDTSAYLATAGGTNTIIFRKTAGSMTDGGAIGNLTAEEIAVAAAKGWTVTLAN